MPYLSPQPAADGGLVLAGAAAVNTGYATLVGDGGMTQTGAAAVHTGFATAVGGGMTERGSALVWGPIAQPPQLPPWRPGGGQGVVMPDLADLPAGTVLELIVLGAAEQATVAADDGAADPAAVAWHSIDWWRPYR
jgi:hypothetical protein